MTNQHEETYNNSQTCWICNEELNTDNGRDHCHITGKFRGAAHNQYNLKSKIPKKLPIITNFDVTIYGTTKTIKKYMSIIIKKNITFIDSNELYKGSLDTPASNSEDNDSKYIMSGIPIDKLAILKRKDAYPYEWVDSYKKFDYPNLSPKECFYSSSKDGKHDNSDRYISNE